MCWEARQRPTRTIQADPVQADPNLRVGDAERDQVADQLKAHCTAGRLTLDEYSDRLGELYAARTWADLSLVLRDLPAAPPSPVAGRPPHRTPGGLGLSPALSCYLTVMVVLVVIWALTSPGGYFWPMWPALGWGFALFRHSHHRTRDD